VVVAADESESVAEFEQEGLQPAGQGSFQVPFGDRAGQVEEVQHVGVAGQLLGQLGVCGRQLRDQPCSAADAAYQPRCAGSSSLSSSTVT